MQAPEGPVNFGAEIIQALESVKQQQGGEAPQITAAEQKVSAQEPATTPAKADPDMDKRFAKLNAASAKVQQERAAIAAEREKLKADYAELMHIKEIRERAKEDPMAWAQLGGYEAADEFATTLIEKGALTPERRRLLEQEKELRELKNWRQTQEEQAKKAQERAQENQLLQQIKEFAAPPEVAERFDLVNRFNAHNLVMNEMVQHWNKTIDPDTGEGEKMSIEEAYEIVESRIDKELQPALESPKIRSRFGALASKAPSAAAAQLAPRQPRGTTITSQMRAQADINPQKMSETERLENAFNFLVKSTRA